MGVGIDYNETLMANVADHSGGNYYHISKEVNMADVFRREWNLMQNLIANNAVASLELASGVEVLDVAGFQWNVQNGKLRIQVPDIYSSEMKRVLIHLRAPANVKTVVALGKGEFTYTDITADKPQTIAQRSLPSIQVIEDRKIVASNFDRDVQSKAAAVEASKKMEKLIGDGIRRRQGAYDVAQEANSQLKSLENEQISTGFAIRRIRQYFVETGGP